MTVQDWPTDEEREMARKQGADAKAANHGALSNPYHRNWPHMAPGGMKEEILGRLWVDGYFNLARFEDYENHQEHAPVR